MRAYQIHWRIDDIEGYDQIKSLDPYGAKLLFEFKNPGVEVLSVHPE